MKKSKALNYFIYVFLAVFIVSGNALTFQVFGRVSIRVGEVLGLILGLVLLSHFVKEILSPSLLYMLAWGGLSLILIICNSISYRFLLGEVLTAFLYLFRFLFFLLLAYTLSKYVKKEQLTHSFLKFINCCYIAVGVIGFLQLIFFPIAYDFYDLFYSIGVYFPDPDPHVNRLISTYFDPNYLACCLLIPITICLYFIRNSEKSQKIRYIFCIAFYIIVVLFTKSRSGILGAAVLCFLYFLFTYDFKHIKMYHLIGALVLIIAGLYLLVFSNISVFVRIRGFLSDASAQARFSSWGKSFEVILDTYFLGIGYNLFGSYNALKYGVTAESTLYGVDSSVLLIVITTGILGLVLWIIHFFFLAKEGKDSSEVRSLIVASVLISSFNNLLFYNIWVFPFYFILYLMTESRRLPSGKSVTH